MEHRMQFDFANILVFAGLGIGFLTLVLAVGSLLRPYVPNTIKAQTYECGETPIEQAWFNFNPRFYIVALIFLIFDVEIAFTYPVATVFKSWVMQGRGATAFIELAVFVGILVLGLAYVWRKGDLQWISAEKNIQPPNHQTLPNEEISI